MPVIKSSTEPPTYDFECPRPSGCDGFVSRGWDRKKDAVDRGQQHEAEHDTGEPMPELNDFRTNGA